MSSNESSVWVEVNLKIKSTNHKINIRRNQSIEAVVQDFITANSLSHQYMPLIVKMIREEISKKLAYEQQLQQQKKVTAILKEATPFENKPAFQHQQRLHNILSEVPHTQSALVLDTSVSATNHNNHSRTALTPNKNNISATNLLLNEMMKIKQDIQRRREKQLSGLKPSFPDLNTEKQKQKQKENIDVRNPSDISQAIKPKEKIVNNSKQTANKHLTNPVSVTPVNKKQAPQKQQATKKLTKITLRPSNKTNIHPHPATDREPQKDNIVPKFSSTAQLTSLVKNNDQSKNNYGPLPNPKSKEVSENGILSNKQKIKNKIQHQKSLKSIHSNFQDAAQPEDLQHLRTQVDLSREESFGAEEVDYKHRLVTQVVDRQHSKNPQQKVFYENSCAFDQNRNTLNNPRQSCKGEQAYNKWKRMEDPRRQPLSSYSNNKQQSSKSQPKQQKPNERSRPKPQKHDDSFFYEKGKTFLTTKANHIEQKFKQLYPFKPTLNLTQNNNNNISMASHQSSSSREVTERLFSHARAKQEQKKLLIRISNAKQKEKQPKHQPTLQADPIRQKIRQRDLEYDAALDELIREGKIQNKVLLGNRSNSNNSRSTSYLRKNKF